MINKIRENWDQILDIMRIEHDISPVAFNTWIKPLTVYSVEGHTITILVNNELEQMCSYIKKKFEQPLKVTISEYFNDVYDIHITTSEELGKIEANQTVEPEKKPAASIITNKTLNPNYTFDTFVVGKNNELAHATALAVASDPGDYGNPLFIYGGVGLGKTHLMHSIAHHIINNRPDLRVLYVTSEKFTNELIDSLKHDKNKEFRDKYRNIDVLLIDDIQFIIGKESTQEEFFHTFNHLHTAGKQIIISSDRPPKDIETLEARLRTRFEWGLIADMSAPDYETRMAILQKKIELEHLEIYHIPDDVLQYIAQNVKNNIRELEGSLNKLIALYRLEGNGRPIDINLAAEAMKDILSPDDNKTVTPELIMDIVSDHFGVSIADLKSNKRPAEIAVPRQIVMYLCRKMTDVPLKSIGILLGGKNHSTIKHGVEKIEHDVEENEQLANTIDIIKKKINPV